MTIRRRTFLCMSGAATLMPFSRLFAATEQQFTLLVGYPAGGTPDTVARTLGAGLRNQNITTIVENKSGAAGRLAIDNLLRAPRDGKTLLLLPSSNLTLYPHFFTDLRYDASRDFALLASVAKYSFALAINPDVPAKTLPEFIAWAQQNPTAAQFGTPGVGSGPYFLGMHLQEMGSFEMQHVPYRGGAPALTDAMGGAITAVFTTLPNLIKPHAAGQLRILAHSGTERVPSIADVPTFSEYGFEQLTLNDQFIVVCHADVEETTRTLNARRLSTAARAPMVENYLKDAEFIPTATSGKQLSSEIKEQYDRWGKIAEAVKTAANANDATIG